MWKIEYVSTLIHNTYMYCKGQSKNNSLVLCDTSKCINVYSMYIVYKHVYSMNCIPVKLNVSSLISQPVLVFKAVLFISSLSLDI